jgi:hypothetical protein
MGEIAAAWRSERSNDLCGTTPRDIGFRVFLVQMVGFRKDMLVLFSQELFTCSVSRVSGCKFIRTELCARVWSL